jgi:protein-L-isoaspartate(D-aspartate) O-methyltransferase
MTTSTTYSQAETLRAALIAQLRDAGCLTSPDVQRAMASVPRHRFLPGIALADAYADQPVVTKRDADGTSLSSASQPSIVATMLEQLDIQPGHRVLEIGAGTGYNAAILRELVGPGGAVTTIDIDPQVADQAQAALADTGYHDVQVITGDGAIGHEANAPYDRIIVTAGAWDIPPAWWDQLIVGGSLVVPLRWRGQTRSIAFHRHGGRMVSRCVELCGFIPMQGSDGEHTMPLAEGAVTIHYDHDQHVDPVTLAAALDQPRQEAWSGVTVGSQESFDGLWLKLTTIEPGTCRIAAESTAVHGGIVTPAIPARTPAIIDGASLAYLALRPRTDEGSDQARRHELGAVGHGDIALVRRFAYHIKAWDRDRAALPDITAYPASMPDDQLSGRLVIEKSHIRMVIS